MKIRLGLGVGIVGLLLACGGGGGGGATPDASGGGGGGGGCTGPSDCTAPQVCEPVSGNCVDPGSPCAGHDDCSGGTYCEESADVCLPSTVGSPCAGDDNCNGACLGGVCGCDAVAHERELAASPLDVFMVLDRTGSMGDDCAYNPSVNATAPVDSKACYATYALADYLINVNPATETTVAFDVMSLSNHCDGTGYNPPEIAATRLPVLESSTLVQRISDENFSGGYGTRIEGALRGIVSYTTSTQVTGRETIGVLITDGDATNCDTDIDDLAAIISAHRTATGIRTFIIGMEGATESNLETLAIAGGAEPHNDYCGGLTPPCHYFNVGDGSGAVLAEALQAISAQSTEIPCQIDVTGLTPPEGETLDYGKVNVTLTEGTSVTTIPQVSGVGSCPASGPAWYYDNPSAPTQIELCENACNTVTSAGDGAELNVVAGCSATVTIVD